MGATWTEHTRGEFTGLDWADWLGRDQPIDPYLVWCDMSGMAGYGAAVETTDCSGKEPPAGYKWPFIVELSETGLLAQTMKLGEEDKVPWIFGCIDVPAAYLREFKDGSSRVDGQYITALAHPSHVRHLLSSPHVLRFQLGLPRIPRVATGAAPREPVAVSRGEYARIVVGVIDDGCAFAHPALLDANDKPRVRYLWDQEHRRQESAPLWQRPADFGYGAEIGPSQLDAAAALGGRDDLAPYIATAYGHFRLDPDTASSQPVAADCTVLPAPTQLAGSHGTSVADLAAGYPPPLRSQARPLSRGAAPGPRPALGERGRAALAQRILGLPDKPPADQAAIDEGLAAIDTADQWDLVFVQLPTRTVADTSGGSLAVHVLDGVRYISRRALKLPYEGYQGVDFDFAENPVIINLSWGALAGGHDGSSILECALAERVNSHNTWIVAAAGNAHRAEHHAELEIEPGGSRSLRWIVGPDNPLEAYLEIWLPDRDPHGRRVADGLERQLMVDVTTPGGQTLTRAGVGQAHVLRDGAQAPVAALVFCRKVVQSRHGTMLLLTAAPTRHDRQTRRPVAPHGQWQVELSWGVGSSAQAAPLRIHAWCERNDLIHGSPRRQQSRVYADSAPRPATQFDPEALRSWRQAHIGPVPEAWRPTPALSSVAGVAAVQPEATASSFAVASGNGTGRFVTAGAYRMLDREMAIGSSGGPDRTLSEQQLWAVLEGRPTVRAGEQGPLLRPQADAPSDRGPASAGLRTIGWRSAAGMRISGTSAAAASVTRVIANVQYWASQALNPPPAEFEPRLLAWMLDDAVASPDAADRPSPTPRLDDRFRKGLKRVR